MADATITIDNKGQVTVINISGQLDESNVDEKIKAIYQVVENNPQNLKLVLNLENLDYLNSKAIGYFTDLYGKIAESGGQIAIANPKSNIVDILQVVGLTQLIQKYDTVDQAKEALSKVVVEPVENIAPSSPVAEPSAAPNLTVTPGVAQTIPDQSQKATNSDNNVQAQAATPTPAPQPETTAATQAGTAELKTSVPQAQDAPQAQTAQIQAAEAPTTPTAPQSVPTQPDTQSIPTVNQPKNQVADQAQVENQAQTTPAPAPQVPQSQPEAVQPDNTQNPNDGGTYNLPQ